MKMERKDVGFEQLSDIYGFRILVTDIAACYQCLGILHTKWSTVPGRFKDFISTPKQNDYRSIHTTLIGPGHQRVELQIRTQEMHEIAEYGVAAHAIYKDRSNEKSAPSMGLEHDSYAYQWLQDTVNLLARSSASSEETSIDFLENTKLELFQDQVFCFTPKGRLISLPRGANSIDFAYALHTDIGNTCVGTKINGRIMPLVTVLQNGDEVDILRSPAQKPLPVWENLVVTGKARAAIRRATRAEVRHQYAGLGKQLMMRQLELLEKDYSDDLMQEAAEKLGIAEVEDLLSRIGRSEMPHNELIRVLFPELAKDGDEQPTTGVVAGEGWFRIGSSALKFNVPDVSQQQGEKDGAVRGFTSDMTITFAPDGGAVPGDRIVGIFEPGVGVTIYPIHAPSLSQFEDLPDLWLDVRWDGETATDQLFPARIVASAMNEPGALAQIAQIIANHGSNIERIELLQGAEDFTDIEVDLLVKDLKALNGVMADIRRCSVVSTVKRINK